MAQALPRNRNLAAPYNPFSGRGNKEDSAYYVLEPGEQFLRPWIRVPGGSAFVWPLGIEGFNLGIDPTLGVHKYIGDNAVEVEVVHLGEERIRLSGSFPGDTSVSNFRALRDVVYQQTPKLGKILYVPIILSHAQRVVVAHAEFDRPDGEIGAMDLSYSIEFARIGIAGKENTPPLEDPVAQPTPAGNRGSGKHTFVVNARYNTLRKVAAFKLGSANRWRDIYSKNEKWFTSRSIPAHRVPDYRLPIGVKLSY